VDILLTRIDNIERAAEFAKKINDKQVWSKLGNA
jgi:hypothetical protein